MSTTIVPRKGNQPSVGKFTSSIVLLYGTHSTIIEEDIWFDGVISDIYFTVPDLDAGTQCTLSIEDSDNVERWSSGLVDEKTTHHLYPGVAFSRGTMTLKITTADAQLANRTFAVVGETT